VIKRTLAAVVLAWTLGLVWFGFSLPKGLPEGASDAVIVPTGAGGRIERGLDVLRLDLARQLLVTGVGREVKPGEFVAQYDVEPAMMECCISLDYSALDTRGNALAAAQWVKANGFRSIRLVTSDWHMRRTAAEFRKALPKDVSILEDAVASQPSFRTLLLEYNKLIARNLERLAS